MKHRHLSILLATAVLSLALLAGGMLLYINRVNSSLWNQSVASILELTRQGGNTLDTFIQKDYDTLQVFASEMSERPSDDQAWIRSNLTSFESPLKDSYYCIDLTANRVYHNDGITDLGVEQAGYLAGIGDQGVLEPYNSAENGVRSLGVYKRFTFGDGRSGLVFKQHRLEDVTDSFALSFYNGSGFSYVVKNDGEVLIRSSNKNSNRTFKNLYDIIDLSGKNSEAALTSFKEAMAGGQAGAAVFSYNKARNVFCYVPISSVEGWYLVSIIPNSVIMKQADNIINWTLMLCGLITVLILAIILIYNRSSREHRREVRQIAYYDSLTGLPNFEKFKLDGAGLVAEASGVKWSALYIDLTGFKLVNDVMGFQFGDEVLCYLADVLTREKDEGDIVCRFSADNFLMLHAYKARAEVEDLCRRIIRGMSSPTIGDKQNVPLSVHIGTFCLEDDPAASDISLMVDRAHMAQKSIKNGRSNQYCAYNSRMRSEMLRRSEIEGAMEQALADGQFVFYLQPKYEVSGKQVVGAEALARWIQPGGKIVSPGEFIPVFEQNHFILQLDEYIFTRVCESVRERLEQGLPVVTVSVNVSRVHVRQPHFVRNYRAIKDRCQIPDGLIELELTESIFLEDIDRIGAIIRELREAGFGCSIDDFGSGYSSLNALKGLPVNVIKLDRNFLLDEGSTGKGAIIVRSIIQMAKKLDMETVAEGVETPEQLAFLKEAGCDMIQGFIFSKPLPEPEFVQLLAADTQPAAETF
ncbi:EAL domain-containing protein [Eubacterium sp. 1001713B170207_170306_E7]|uniref:bifunctional diguanylate cyclase/phosphodiesterase n=1 Tax=Eubacterium sp. 1001713B170207_170306_E7 TaxID=2787097 RepID=UPI001896E9F5|nr:EAL domain-containing protein [Eubacterium sp. 1001713B170207_170306_E7]